MTSVASSTGSTTTSRATTRPGRSEEWKRSPRCAEATTAGRSTRRTGWRSIPGEVRYRSARAQTILSSAGNTAISTAIDPIVAGDVTGKNDCVTTPSADEPGTANWRLRVVTGHGYTLLGAPTMIADLKVSATYPELAARLWDVAPNGMQTLIARALYRPTGSGRVVFQLHANAWHFAAGHVVKLQLLGRDAPYARSSNGTFTITVSHLDLRLPVHERPGPWPGAPSGAARRAVWQQVGARACRVDSLQRQVRSGGDGAMSRVLTSSEHVGGKVEMNLAARAGRRSASRDRREAKRRLGCSPASVVGRPPLNMTRAESVYRLESTALVVCQAATVQSQPRIWRFAGLDPGRSPGSAFVLVGASRLSPKNPSGATGQCGTGWRMTGGRGASPACGRRRDRATTNAAIASGSETARCPNVLNGSRVPIAGHAKTSQLPMCTRRSENGVLSQPTRASVTMIAPEATAAAASEMTVRAILALVGPPSPTSLSPHVTPTAQTRCLSTKAANTAHTMPAATCTPFEDEVGTMETSFEAIIAPARTQRIARKPPTRYGFPGTWE